MNPTLTPINALAPEQEKLLDERLASLQSATASLAAPAPLEAQLMSAFKAHHSRHRAGKRRSEIIAQWFAPGLALAASACISAWMVFTPMAGPALDSGAHSAFTAASALMYADTPFIALQSLEQIALEPRPRLIETAVPRMWLASYGVPVDPQSAGDSLRAEMLVSASGQPLAMRFVP
ncbi:MAG: hypothetical protein IPP88_03935 [Betaproteobacteria bacterium]|nr:hypothetical protein [Betaproteobacteria bacterium]